MHKAEVAGAQKRTFATVRQMSVKSLAGGFWAIPVAVGDAGAGNPDLADAVGRAGGQLLRIGDAPLGLL